MVDYKIFKRKVDFSLSFYFFYITVVRNWIISYWVCSNVHIYLVKFSSFFTYLIKIYYFLVIHRFLKYFYKILYLYYDYTLYFLLVLSVVISIYLIN